MLYIKRWKDSLNNEHTKLFCNWIVIRDIERRDLGKLNMKEVKFEEIKDLLFEWDKKKIDALEKNVSLF